jgi:hypothetical protein
MSCTQGVDQMTDQQKVIIGILIAVTVLVFAGFGCALFFFLSSQGGVDARPVPAQAVAAAQEQPPAPPPTETPKPLETPTPTQTPLPTATSTRVVSLAVLTPTPEPTRIRCHERIMDFETSGLVTNDEVRSYILAVIPVSHLDRCQKIRYIPQQIAVQDQQAAGRFIPMFRQISVYTVSEEFQNREELLNTLTHEIGHNVHYNMRIDDLELARRWGALHKDIGAGFVSDYARSDEYEDFAETYMVYIRDPALLRRFSTAKYDFMRQQVFAGREY